MANGLYMGGLGMYGEKSADIAELIKEKERVEGRFKDKSKKRGFWKQLGNVAKKFFPGAGHVFDFVSNKIAQDQFDLFSNTDVHRLEGRDTFFTAGLGDKLIKSFSDAEDMMNPSFMDSIMSSLLDYAGTTEGGGWIEKEGKEFTADLWEGTKDFAGDVWDWGKNLLPFEEGGRVPNGKVSLGRGKSMLDLITNELGDIEATQLHEIERPEGKRG